MKDRFDLENEIMKLHSFADNIESAVEYLAESDVDPKVIDTMSNMLLGTSTILGLHAEKMFDTMTQCFKLDKYKDSTKTSNKDWTSEIAGSIHHGDMSYNPDNSELCDKIVLVDSNYPRKDHAFYDPSCCW